MKVDLHMAGEVLVASIREPQIDAHTAPMLTQALEEEIDKGRSRVIVDMSEVCFLDSSGLGALIRLLKHLPENGNFALCGCRAPVLELLKLTRLDRILTTYPTRAEALDSLGA